MAGDAVKPGGPPLRGGPWAEEIRSLREQIGRYRKGLLGEERFRALRLWHGIYEQRQPNVHMVRVKIPNGILYADQLLALAEAAERFATGVVHLTTRQDAQLYFVKLEDVPDLLERLARAGLTTREACGNAVRNVVCCPLSGVAREEPFPVWPYAQAVSRFLLRHPAAQLLGRKFKIAFCGCGEDCIHTRIHDIGARPVLANGGEPGFHIVVGGGLGATPHLAETLEDFLPARQILGLCRAILDVFSLHGERRNRARARLKFLVSDLGTARFRALYEAAWRDVWRREGTDLQPERYLREEEARAIRRLPDPPEPVVAPPEQDSPEWSLWLQRNTIPQRQGDLRTVVVCPPLGDLDAQALRALARLARAHGSGDVRTTIRQELLLRDVPVDRLLALHAELRTLGLADPVARTPLDPVSCPGAETCRLGLTTSRALARAIAAELRTLDLPADLPRGDLLRISGCPNGCGQHYVAAIGLHGIARRQNGRHLPYYQLHLGGSGERLAQRSLRIPARNVPAAVRKLVGHYLSHRAPGESLEDFLARMDPVQVEDLLASELRAPEDPRDWAREEPFSLRGLRQGECAGAGVDLSLDPFGEVVSGLQDAASLLAHGRMADAAVLVHRASLAAARILLERGRGIRCRTDGEIRQTFPSRFAEQRTLALRWEELLETTRDLLRRKSPEETRVRRAMANLENFLGLARQVLRDLEAEAQNALTPSNPARAGSKGGDER
jgi:sulfite reductase (ferredoxin)